MKSLFSNNKNVKNILCVIDVFAKFTWVKSLKDKKSKIVIEIVNETNGKPNHYGLIKE